MIKADELARMLKNPNEPKKQFAVVSYAKIDPAYTTGKPKLIFDGETTVTVKHYPYISTYTPKANDRVMLIGDTVMGAI